MKIKGLLLAIILGLGIPWGLYSIVYNRLEKSNTIQATEMSAAEDITMQDDASTLLPVILPDGTLRQMDLEEYIICAVMGEMPADFESEALKAQAVVARTYALRMHTLSEKHESGALCTDSGCCQAFCSTQDYIAKGNTETAVEKIKNAVRQTENQVLTYNGELIEATYFSCSGGKTEEALAVWGQDVPYLRSVTSPGEEGAPHYVDTVSFTVSELEERLGIPLTGDWLGDVTYTEGGGVDTIQIGAESFRGTQLRSLLSLRSTAFVMTAVADRVIITTKGYGHRVGMSQYGADAMAVKGHSYVEILEYYYPGAKMETWIG